MLFLSHVPLWEGADTGPAVPANEELVIGNHEWRRWCEALKEAAERERRETRSCLLIHRETQKEEMTVKLDFEECLKDSPRFR